ncbi:MAG: aminoglycoside phosphotransferase family protein [Candidatus Heimdallarchaeota archaeon]|nr:MAG: aminoglycoside phosphotransferase family protein [Candidatus Heimdallarchaeota archaeon]
MNHNAELLEQVPPILLPKKITSARLITGGLNNRNIIINESWLVKEYLIKDEANDPVYLRFLREKDSLLLLKNDHHAPQLLKYYDDGIKFYITREWVEGNTLTHDYLQTNMESLINAIMSIQSITESTSGDFHYYDVIKRYLLEYKGIRRHYPTSPPTDRKFSLFPPYERIDRFFNDHITQLQKINSVNPLVRIHGDLVFSNIIVTPESSKIVFIDWEYSTLADPCIDLAYFITQNQLSQEIQRIFTKKFEEKLGFQIIPRVLELTCDLMNLMSGLWYIIQAARFQTAPHLVSEENTSFNEYIALAQDRFRALQLIESL